MKKFFVPVIACAFAFCVLCGCTSAIERTPEGDTFDNRSPVQVTDEPGKTEGKLSAEELIAFHQNGEKYPENFVFGDLKGYGRVVESASSADEARSVVKNHFNSGWCKTVENELQVETELYYGLYAKWAYYSGGDFTQPPTCYYDEFVVSFKKNVYDMKNERFGTKDERAIKRILDYITYSETYQIGGYKVYGSEISQKDGRFEYEVRVLEVCYGDWGVQDSLTFVKRVRKIDTATGETLSAEREMITNAFVDGACTNAGIVE